MKCKLVLPVVFGATLLLAFFSVGNHVCLAEGKGIVTIQLRWKHQFQFAGYYAAIEKGFYTDEGIKVKLNERRFGAEPYSQVIEGSADYGIADAGLLLQKVQGKPVVLLAQIFQHSPLIFISRQESGIISPYEMVGKTVMYDPTTDNAPLNAMLLEAMGADGMKKITLRPHSMDYDDLVSGRVDVMSAYITNQPFHLKRQGHVVNIINPQNYGIDFYGDNLFTSERELREHPERVKKMVRASLKGWQYAIEHSDEIIDLILARYNSQNLDREYLEFEAQMIKMMILADLVPLGDVNLGRYQRVAKMYQQLGSMKEARVPEDFVYRQQMVELSEKEQAWLSSHPHIILGSNEELKPYVQISKDGTVVGGFSNDYLNLLQEKTGVVIDLKVGSWPEQIGQAAQRELDGLSLVTHWEAEENNLLLSDPIHKMHKLVFMRNDSDQAINSLQDLQGMRVGVCKGITLERQLVQHIPGVQLVEAKGVRDLVELLASGAVDAVIGGFITHRFLDRHTLTNIHAVYTITEEIPAYGFAVRSDWPELLSIINKGLAAISEDERTAILNKWTRFAEVDSGRKRLILTEEEKRWLAEHPELRIAIDPGRIPIEFVNAEREHSGITADIVAKAEKELGFSANLQPTMSWAQTMDAVHAGQIDMVPALVKNREHLEFFNFTKPYLEFPVVILAHEDLPYISGMADLSGKRLAVIEKSSLTASMQKEFPAYDYVTFPDTMTAFKALAAKKVDAFPVNTATVNYALKRQEFKHLRVAAPTSYTFPLSFGVRKDWPQLITILEKFIDSIHPEEKLAIEQGWINLQVEREVDWRAMSRIVAVIISVGVLIVLVFFFWNRRLSKEVDLRHEAEGALKKYQNQLEHQVEERTADLATSNELLRASERKFKGIFHNTYQFIGLLNTQGVLLECNDTSLAFIGKEAKEVVGCFFWEKPWWNCSQQMRDDLREYIKQAAAGEFVMVDVAHRDLQGKVHYVIFSLKPIFDDAGQVVFLVAESRDITQQKLNELRFQTLFNTANDAILIMNEDRFVQCNARALDIFGCNYSELLKASLDQFLPPCQPDGRKSRDSAMEKIKAAYAGERLTFEWKHCRYDGTPFDAEVSLNVAELEGKEFIQAIVRDVSERKNAEKQLSRLASAIEQTAEAIIITNPEGVIEYVNPAFENITGYSKDEALGQPSSLLKSGEHEESFYKNLWDTITAGKIWNGQFSNKTKKGAIIVENTTISPVLNAQGENMGYVSVARDMTKQIKMESDLRQAQKMEAIGTLAGGIAHDFNNILTSIFGFSELASMHMDNKDKLQNDLGEVRKAAERAKGLVQQILTFSRKSEQSKRPVQISLLVKEVIKLLRASIPSSIEIKRQIHGSEQTVLADPVQIHQVLMNLGTNAFQAMRESGGTLSFMLQEKLIVAGDQFLDGEMFPGRYIEIEVSDTGSGMDEATREKIFEPYFTTKEVGEGTGLGLAVVHGIVQELGGDIHVYSEPGQGTTFRVYLPVVQPGSEIDSSNSETLSNNRGREHILFVDDEEKILDIADNIFEAYGYRISTHSNPQQALDSFSKDPADYDLLITDMTMPGMSGLELADQIMKLRPGFPVVLCTGHSDLINKEKALSLGIRNYVTKPMVMSKMVAGVKRIFEEKERS